jgi:peptidoglycan/LPS O-acetylase OafA/YrhL
MNGMRKFWMTAIVVAALLAGLVIVLAFKAMTDGMWTAWCSSVAGTGLVGVAANVVTKKIVEPKKGKR